jgi:hypothetical protein
MTKLLTKLMCKLGRHWWGYRSSKTGIFLHCFYDGTPSINDWTMRRCWDCNRTEDREKVFIGYWVDSTPPLPTKGEAKQGRKEK